MSHNAGTVSVLEISAWATSRYWSNRCKQLMIRASKFINAVRFLTLFPHFFSLSAFLSTSTYLECHPEYVQPTDNQQFRTPDVNPQTTKHWVPCSWKSSRFWTYGSHYVCVAVTSVTCHIFVTRRRQAASRSNYFTLSKKKRAHVSAFLRHYTVMCSRTYVLL